MVWRAKWAKLNVCAIGNESIAVVEFAPFQKVPNEKKKADTRAGTIEKGVHFCSLYPPNRNPSPTFLAG